MAPLLWMGFNCLKATQPLRGGGLVLIIQFPEIPGSHFIDLRKMKGWVDLGATQWFWTRDPGLWIQRLNYFNRIPQKELVNEMEQEDEYINALDFLNNCYCWHG